MSEKDWRSKKKRYLGKKQEHEFARRRSRQERRKRRGAIAVLPPAVKNLHAVQIAAPNVFSLIHNPEEVIPFLNLLLHMGKGRRIKIRFDDVTSITPDAAMALVSVMHRLPKGTIGGNTPASETCKAMLLESGFFDHVRHGFKLPENVRGRISRRTSKQVEGSLANEMIMLGTTAIHGTPTGSEASYRVLVEAMQNTSNHANYDSKNKIRDEDMLEKETWWAMVYADVARQKVCFAFLDTGVGIFRSARLTLSRKLDRALRVAADQDILADLMAGEGISSRTGLTYRGKGLPSMRELCHNGEISNFVILSNGVHGEVDCDSYRGLKDAFRGTLLYWEI